jgi:hypothetical protein
LLLKQLFKMTTSPQDPKGNRTLLYCSLLWAGFAVAMVLVLNVLLHAQG